MRTAKSRLAEIIGYALLWLTLWIIPYVLYIETYSRVLVVELAILAGNSFKASTFYHTIVVIAYFSYLIVNELKACVQTAAIHFIMQCLIRFRAFPFLLKQEAVKLNAMVSCALVAWKRLAIEFIKRVMGTEERDKLARAAFAVIITDATAVARERIAYICVGKETAARARVCSSGVLR